jgi:hypothetical protein
MNKIKEPVVFPVSDARMCSRTRNQEFMIKYGWAPNIDYFEKQFDDMRSKWPWDLELHCKLKIPDEHGVPLTYAYDSKQPIIDLNPVDLYNYGLVLKKTTKAISPYPSSIWGSAGDPPWPNANRRLLLAKLAKKLRLLGFRILAKCIVNIHIGNVPVGTTAGGVYHFMDTAELWLHYEPAVFMPFVVFKRIGFGSSERQWRKEIMGKYKKITN